ncbi:MAG: efflux RND transporter periplasmic adaptor subunit [Phycisphaerae bacterium]|jgi:HlyD family secretion protein
METTPSLAPGVELVDTVRPRRRFRGRILRWAAPAVVLALVVTAIGAAIRSGVWQRLVGAGDSGRSYFEVQPVNLSITLVESGEIKPRDSLEIKCDLEGQATILKIVEESARVKKGDLLVELASDELKEKFEREQIDLQGVEADLRRAVEDLGIQRNQNASDVRKAEIEVQVATIDLEKYIEGDYKQKLKSAEIDIQQAELDLDRKREELEKNKQLKERGFVTAEKIKQLVFELTKAEMTLDRYKTAKWTLTNYEFKKEQMQRTSAVERAHEELERVKTQAESRIAQAEAKVKQLEATLAMRQGRVNRLKEQLSKCKITAPADGVVQYPNNPYGWNDDRIAEGVKVREGQTLLVLPDTTRMLVSTRIHEADRHKVSEGLPAIVRVPAVPGRTFSGKISKIAKFADSSNRWLNPELKEHTTEILLDETDAPLSPGDSAEVEILIETIHNALAVPVQTVHARGRKNFVFVQNGLAADPVEVKLGRASVTSVEIIEGVTSGDRVLLHADERLLAKLPAVGGEKSDEGRKPDDAAKGPAAAAAPAASQAAGGTGASAAGK